MAVDYLSALNSKGSGLNITQLVDSLVKAETEPKKKLLNDKIDKQTSQISALGEVASELDTLKTNVLTFKDKTKLVTSSADTNTTLSVTSPSIAKAFTSDINISALATSQTLEFTGFSLPTSTSGSGTITIDFGTWITSASTDVDSLFSNSSVSANTSLGSPTSHSSLGGTITIATAGGGNQSSTVFTVVGTDMAGNSMTETITGATGGNTATGSKVFKTVTSITPGSTVGSGAVTIGHAAATFGPNTAKTSSTVTISSGATLSSIANSLSQVSGVSASVVNKGDGTYSLLVRSDTGQSNAIKMTVSEASGDAGLATFDTTSDNATHQTAAATNATLSVDGATLYRTSNSISDIFDGYTLDITKTTSSAFRISSSLDKSSALTVLKDFLTTINSTREILNDFTRVGSNTQEAGVLKGNVAVSSIKDGINKIITDGIVGYGNDKLYLSELGVRTSTDGKLSVNETIFNSQLDSDSTVFDAIFNSLFSSDSSYLKVEASIGSSNPTPGSYSYSSDGSTASLEGIGMTAKTESDGTSYFISSGTASNSAGIKITPSQTVNSANIFYGRSMVHQLETFLTNSLTSSGILTKSQSNADTKLNDLNNELLSIDDKVKILTTRYKTQFGAMESVVTSLKSTGEYLDNLITAWNDND
ncbi:MAG: hypothetical protein CMN50_03645 [SAR116 cluster bacterium]|nr:hypothetical protein [SAR116 cluster bacterium]|tara:strand:- start:389 stop:2335 length:1947 start_codon:yes stop_codon:yes gene_type:complete